MESEDQADMSMGMDSGWFSTFLEAFFDSFPAADLPIWRVFKIGSSGVRMPITGEDSWDAAWDRVAAHRKADPTQRYDCSHSIAYER
jgi:hypothetical protein